MKTKTVRVSGKNEISLEGAIRWLEVIGNYPETLKYCRHALTVLKADPYKEPTPEPLPSEHRQSLTGSKSSEPAPGKHVSCYRCGSAIFNEDYMTDRGGTRHLNACPQ